VRPVSFLTILNFKPLERERERARERFLADVCIFSVQSFIYILGDNFEKKLKKFERDIVQPAIRLAKLSLVTIPSPGTTQPCYSYSAN
jgi:hypothetical protein